MDNVIGGKFKLGRKIGGGSFGELFLGELKKKLLLFYQNHILCASLKLLSLWIITF